MENDGNCREPAIDLVHALQGTIDPVPEHSAAHCGLCLIQQIEQRALFAAAMLQRLRQLQIPACRDIQIHIGCTIQNTQTLDMAQRIFLRLLQILHESARCRNGNRERFAAESPEGSDTEVTAQTFAGRGKLKCFFLIPLQIILARDAFCQNLLHKQAFIRNDLRRLQTSQLIDEL